MAFVIWSGQFSCTKCPPPGIVVCGNPLVPGTFSLNPASRPWVTGSLSANAQRKGLSNSEKIPRPCAALPARDRLAAWAPESAWLADPSCSWGWGRAHPFLDKQRDHFSIEVTPDRLTMHAKHQGAILRACINMVNTQIAAVVGLDRRVVGSERVVRQVGKAFVGSSQYFHGRPFA